MLQDFRYALRAITRTKGTTAVILLSLGLGTGVNAAVSGVLNALLFRGPSGVEDPSRLVDIYTAEFSGLPYGPSSYPDFLSVKSRAKFFAAIAAVDDSAVVNLRIGRSMQSARLGAVSDDYFRGLQLQAHAGRLLEPADSSRNPAALVMSYSMAHDFGGASVVGEKLTIEDREYVIVGVAPRRFRGLRAGRECDAWILMTGPSASRGDRRLAMVGRLAPDVTRKEAEKELTRISDDLAAEYPGTNRGNVADPDAPRRITALRFSQLDPGASSHVFLIGVIVAGATVLLLASACLNVGSLLLSRAVARRQELSIKMALGATRSRLVRQLLTETLCLSLAGGAFGLLFAIWTAEAIPALFMVEHAEFLDTALDLRHLLPTLLTVGVACLAGAAFGIAPALHGTASPAVTALRADAGGVSAQRGGGRLRALLVGGQVSLSILLLLGTGLLVMSLKHALEGSAQPAVKKVAFASIELPGRFGDPVHGVAVRNKLLERLPSVDGVETVGWASTLPLGRGNRRPFRIHGAAADVVDSIELDTNVVSPGYFRALAMPCLEGRLFDAGDHMLAPPVVIVDELLARRYFGAKAVGRELLSEEGAHLEIVGVVRSGTYRTLQASPQPTVYFPSSQDYLWRGHLLVRAARPPATMLASIKRAVLEVGDGAEVLQISTLETYLSESLALDRLTTTLVGLCGLIALAMSTIGVYGVMTDAVQRRTREIGLRMALGAGRTQVARLVFTEVLSLTAAGLLAGGLATFAMSHAARSFVYGVPSLDVGTVAVVSAALAIVIAIAEVVPLRRALRVNPNIALRAE